MAQALAPTLPQQLIDRRADRSWFADYGGTDLTIPFVNPTMEALHGLVEIYREALGRTRFSSAADFGEVSHACVGQFGAGGYERQLAI